MVPAISKIWVLLILILLLISQACKGRVVYSEPSKFGYVFVVDEGDLRYLRFDSRNGDDQSMISLKDPKAVPMDYIRFATIGLAYIQRPERVLMIGLGGGTFTNLLFRVYPELLIDVVEINSVVVRVAKQFFRVPEDKRYRIHLQDGEKYLKDTQERYDLIFVDAYDGGEDMPSQLTTKKFFELTRSRLTKGGVVVFNVSAVKSVEEKLEDLIRKVFPSVACIETPEKNLILIGSRKDTMPDQPTLSSRASLLTFDLGLPFDLEKVAAHLGNRVTDSQ